MMKERIVQTKNVPLRKIQLLSNGLCYGPCPEADDEMEQRLTILSDGRVWFTGYNYGVHYNPVPGRKMQFKIPKEHAAELFAAFENYFGNDPMILRATDVGSWDLVLTDTEGNKQKFFGSMHEDLTVDGIGLSDLGRKLLPIDDLWAFRRPWEDEQD